HKPSRTGRGSRVTIGRPMPHGRKHFRASQPGANEAEGGPMSLESVRAFLAERAPDVVIVDLEMESTTMAMSAAWHVKPAQVAKTLSVRAGERTVLVVTCGDSRLDNKKAKDALGGRVKMLAAEESASLTGHPPGGVCPFGLATPLPVYFDVRLRVFDEV